MQSLTSTNSTSQARGLRVAKLSGKLATRLQSSPEDVCEVCEAFDCAVEFAALEGVSIADAIAAFVEEGATVGWAVECAELARLAGYGSAGADLASMSLPLMPKQTGWVLGTSNADTSAVELEDIAASNPGLAGKLLVAANSPRYQPHVTITRLRDAISRLGVPETRLVLLTTCVADLFGSKPVRGLWKHSQTVAHTARGLAPLAGVKAETAYLAGLLHDIGRLGFTKLPAEQRVREQEWLAAGFPVAYSETLAYGIDHAAFGAQLLRGWEIPEEIIEAVSLHTRPERADFGLNAILSLADDPAPQTADAASEDLWPQMRRTIACRKTGISPEALAELSLCEPHGS